jgi:hypothetical protein
LSTNRDVPAPGGTPEDIRDVARSCGIPEGQIDPFFVTWAQAHQDYSNVKQCEKRSNAMRSAQLVEEHAKDSCLARASQVISARAKRGRPPKTNAELECIRVIAEFYERATGKECTAEFGPYDDVLSDPNLEELNPLNDGSRLCYAGVRLVNPLMEGRTVRYLMRKVRVRAAGTGAKKLRRRKAQNSMRPQ